MRVSLSFIIYVNYINVYIEGDILIRPSAWCMSNLCENNTQLCLTLTKKPDLAKCESCSDAFLTNHHLSADNRRTQICVYCSSLHMGIVVDTPLRSSWIANGNLYIVFTCQ